jgi:hypothetical protein
MLHKITHGLLTKDSDLRSGAMLSRCVLLTAVPSSLLFAGYTYFTAHYIILSREDAQAMFMVLMTCLGGVPH